MLVVNYIFSASYFASLNILYKERTYFIVSLIAINDYFNGLKKRIKAYFTIRKVVVGVIFSDAQYLLVYNNFR